MSLINHSTFPVPDGCRHFKRTSPAAVSGLAASPQAPHWGGAGGGDGAAEAPPGSHGTQLCPQGQPSCRPQERLGQPAERLCQTLTCRGPTPAFQTRVCTGDPGERGGCVDTWSLTHALAHMQAQGTLGRGVDAWTRARSHTCSLTRRPRAHVSKGEGRLPVRGERRAWVLP